MIKTKLFIDFGLSAIRDYQKFVEDNQHIEIISVNILELDNVLLTYKE